ncbi:hypothetical protein RhiirC2_801435, partial [Rhizophagus irregularis]
LTAGRKKGGALPNVPDTPNITQEAEPDTVNTCQILLKETIRDLAQRIIWNNLGEAEVKVIAKALAESASNASATTLIPDITRSANKIQKEHSKQCEDEGIDYPDYFSLESVKKRLDMYDKAISSGQLRDPKKSRVLWFNTFLKKDEFLPETGKPLFPNSLCELGAVFAVVSNCAKNLSEAMTITSEALRYSSDNHAFLAKNYTIVNYRKRG